MVRINFYGTQCFTQIKNISLCFVSDVVVKYPKFLGLGYMAFSALRGAYRQFVITVKFRPDTHNGLLLFSGETPDARSDFFSLALIDGNIEFRCAFPLTHHEVSHCFCCFMSLGVAGLGARKIDPTAPLRIHSNSTTRHSGRKKAIYCCDVISRSLRFMVLPFLFAA